MQLNKNDFVTLSMKPFKFILKSEFCCQLEPRNYRDVSPVEGQLQPIKGFDRLLMTSIFRVCSLTGKSYFSVVNNLKFRLKQIFWCKVFYRYVAKSMHPDLVN